MTPTQISNDLYIYSAGVPINNSIVLNILLPSDRSLDPLTAIAPHSDKLVQSAAKPERELDVG